MLETTRYHTLPLPMPSHSQTFTQVLGRVARTRFTFKDQTNTVDVFGVVERRGWVVRLSQTSWIWWRYEVVLDRVEMQVIATLGPVAHMRFALQHLTDSIDVFGMVGRRG